MSRITQTGKYRLSSLSDLHNISIRASLERRSTAFDFGRVAASAVNSEEVESVDFRWQEALEHPGQGLMMHSQRAEGLPRPSSSPRRIFTITQQMIENNAFEVPEPIDFEHESFLGERRRQRNRNRRRREERARKRAAAGREKAGPANLVVAGDAKRSAVTVGLSQRMFVMAILGRNRPPLQHSTSSETSGAPIYSNEFDASHSNVVIICELRVTHDNAGYQLCVTPDFSTEPYVVRAAHSEDAYSLQLNLVRGDLAPLRSVAPGATTLEGVAGAGAQSTVLLANCPRDTALDKRRAEMALAQPKESHVKVSVFGEIVCAAGFPMNKTIFVLYTSSSPKGWSLLGGRQEDELNATFSAVSILTRNPHTGMRKTVASFGHPFHFNFTSTEENSSPTLHFKVVHFAPETGRFHTLGEGRSVVGAENDILQVSLTRRVPKGLVARLREKFLGGEPLLTGIVINQTISRQCCTEPAGELVVRVQVLRQSRRYRLEDLLKESRLRLIKSSGQTLSTVQSALSAFQEARVRMIQARQEERSLVDNGSSSEQQNANKENDPKKKNVPNTTTILQLDKEHKEHRREDNIRDNEDTLSPPRRRNIRHGENASRNS